MRFLRQPGQQRLDERPDSVQHCNRISHRWLVNIARVPEHPGIFRELHDLINKRLQRRVQFDRLLAQFPEIVRPGGTVDHAKPESPSVLSPLLAGSGTTHLQVLAARRLDQSERTGGPYGPSQTKRGCPHGAAHQAA